MIELSQLEAQLTEPYIGCEISTLSRCYEQDWRRLCIYQSDLGGVLCQFEGRLLLSGCVDPQDLLSFVPLIGVSTIEGLAQELPTGLGSCNHHRLFRFSGQPAACAAAQSHPALARVFEILVAADSTFSNRTHYLSWLSDVTRKQNLQLGCSYLLEDCCTASVVAKGMGYGLIAQVATLPKSRRQGLAKLLILQACKDLLEEGCTPYLVSQQPALDAYYQQMGFSPVGQKAIIRL